MYVIKLYRVDSWPPCIELVDVNANPGIPSSALADQRSPVVSRKYFKGAAMEPNLVGDPSARPLQLIRSSFVQ